MGVGLIGVVFQFAPAAILTVSFQIIVLCCHSKSSVRMNEFRAGRLRRLQLSPATSDGESQLVVVLGFFVLALLCFLAKPCPVPEAAVRRRRRLFVRRNRRRGDVNIDPEIRKDHIARSLVTQTVVAIGDDGNLKLTPLKEDVSHDTNLPAGVPRCRSKSPTGRDKVCCSICLEAYAIGDRVAWDRHDHTCLHVFHEECITEWLMTHNDCPSCRLRLIKADEHEESASVTSTCSSVFEVVDGLISKVNSVAPLEIKGPS